MFRRQTSILPVLVLGFVSITAHAQAADGDPQSPSAQMLDTRRARLAQKREVQFRAADRDADRGLTREELAASDLPKVLLRRFDDIDSNHDGKLSPEELQALERRQIRAATAPNALAEETANP
ncbi:MAG: hypothetical protein QM661_09260 [Solimonas sp.]